MTLISFHNDPAIRDKYLARVEAHRVADEIIQGMGWDGYSGCAIGCTLDAYTHEAYPVELGIPLVLAHLEDVIHERLPDAKFRTWPGEFLKAAGLGKDLSGVWPQFAQWLLVDPTWGVLQYAKTDQARNAIQRVAHLYRNGGTLQEFAEARAAAEAEAAEAARKAAEAAEAAWAARAAAEAAEAAAAAWAARAARAEAEAAWMAAAGEALLRFMEVT